jgi:hypothetical protein
LTGHSLSTGVRLLGVPLAMSKILPRSSDESTYRLMASEGLIARGGEEDDEDEEEDKKQEEEDNEDKDDGYSE